MNFDSIEKNPIQFLKNAKLEDIELVLNKCSDKYYNSENGETLLSDNVFDIIKDYLAEKIPKSKFIMQIGAGIKKDKVKLPVHMGSMNKKKTEKEINKWIKDYPNEVLLSDKLDGISFLMEYKNKKLKIYTRGNGTEGKDITDIKNYVNLPKENKNNFIVRGEILVTKKNYIKVKDNFKNPRSFIAGISNQKDFSKKVEHLKLVDFVIYELVHPLKCPSEQMVFCKDLGFKVVENKVLEKFSFTDLKETLLKRKKESEYEIDGLIITSNNLNDRNKDGNPKYSFAFKMDLDFAITKVIRVEWNASKHGKLKPIVIIEPTMLCGTTNRKATGNNADFIVKNGIGPGAIVKMIKGGEIIPKIVEVLEKTEPQLPEVDYMWNETKKEIILENMKDNEGVKIKRITTFFRTLEVPNIGPGLYKKMYLGGFETIKKIMNIQKEDLLKLEGIKEKNAYKIYESIHTVIDNPLEVEKVITGSCIFGNGIGYKILKKITEKYPNIFFSEMDITLEMLNEIPSIQEKTANKILESLEEIKQFLEDHQELKFGVNEIILESKIFENKNFVITGKRNKSVIDKINKEGGNIQTTVNKNTNMLIVLTLETETSKMKKAKELGIDIYTNEEFVNKYCK